MPQFNKTLRSLLLKAVLPALALPMLGVRLAGLPMDRYLEFPPRGLYVDHAPFSWPVFIAVAVLEIAALLAVGSRVPRFKFQVSGILPFFEIDT